MSKKIKLPDGVTIDSLKENYQEAYSAYTPAFQRARVLDATDRGKLWKAVNAKFPTYQVLPDTNDVAYVKSNLLASLYSVGRSASILPTSEHDKDLATNINIMLDHIWDTCQVPYYQMQAGERAALLNLGITQVGWDNSILKGTGDTFSKGSPVFKNIDPLKFMRDPYATDLDTSAYCMTWDSYHKNVILRNKLYDNFKEYMEEEKAVMQQDNVEKMTDQTQKPTKNYYKVVIHWVQIGGKVHEIHTIDNEHVLLLKEDISPSAFPFAELYCNLPAGDVIGTSEPSKIFANSVAYNLMNSIILTADVKNQKPPRFINDQSMLNVRDFVQHGADSDYTFIVQGDASRAVHYHEFPQVSSSVISTLNTLKNDMQQVTGVDGSYTGKDTGSILTTGGIEQMLDQATLVDQPKIVNYEHYAERLTKLVLGNLVKFGNKRTYFIKDPNTSTYENISVDFSEIKDDSIFNYALSISAHLPKNKQRIAQMANVIMEKQMQYGNEGQQVSLMTPQEWLMMQDLPMQEMMLERMGVEQTKDYVDQVAKVLFQYAELLDSGVSPEDALLETADALQSGVPSMLGASGRQPMDMGMPQQMGPDMMEQGMPPMDMGMPPQMPMGMEEENPMGGLGF